MKKGILVILALSMTLSFAACGQNNKGNNADVNNSKAVVESKDKEVKEEKKYETFMAMIDGISYDEYYFRKANDSLKLYKEEKLNEYLEKAAKITTKALADNNISEENAVIIKLYKNANGNKEEKDFVIVYNENKEVEKVHEVFISIDKMTYEPSFKEIIENKEIMTEQFKNLFKAHLEEEAKAAVEADK